MENGVGLRQTQRFTLLGFDGAALYRPGKSVAVRSSYGELMLSNEVSIDKALRGLLL